MPRQPLEIVVAKESGDSVELEKVHLSRTAQRAEKRKTQPWVALSEVERNYQNLNCTLECVRMLVCD